MLRAIHSAIVGGLQLLILLPIAIVSRLYFPANPTNPRLLWAGPTIVSLAMNASALRASGYISKSIGLRSPMRKLPVGFDVVLNSTGSKNALRRWVGSNIEAPCLFIYALFRFDVFHFFFCGSLLSRTPLQNLEPWILRLAGKHTIIFPYGSDAFAPTRIADLSIRAALLADYPSLGVHNRNIINRMDRFCRDASLIIGCLVHVTTLPRWDKLMLTCYPVDTHKLTPRYPNAEASTLRIFHAPNHRMIKGTEYLIEAVRKLRASGRLIELDICEGSTHHETLQRMARADLVLDQLHFGYGLTALEGMALGKMVVSGQNSPEHDQLFLQLGLENCPIIWASPSTIEARLEELLESQNEWEDIGKRSRDFAELYHSIAATTNNWKRLYKCLGLEIR